MDDLITSFFQATRGVISPEIFRKWAAISMVAGALERRVWIRTHEMITFPNLYILCVGAPGVGKAVIDDVRNIWANAREPGSTNRAFHLCPHNITSASIIDALSDAKKTKILPGGGLFTYHSVLVAAEEFQYFLPAFDPAIIARVNELYKNAPNLSEKRRHGPVKDTFIERPCLNILGGAQPSYIASTFPEEAWTTGLARRLIMVYAAAQPKYRLSDVAEISDTDRAAITERVGQLATIYGQLDYTTEALQRLAQWHESDRPPKPTHSKLAHYETNRTQNIIKLAGVSALSRNALASTIELVDVERAMVWLFEAESFMPDIFREMIGRSDSQVIEELHLFLTTEWRRRGQKPIEEAILYDFLRLRVPAEKAKTIIEVAERSGVIARIAGGTLYVPRPKFLHGME